MTLRILLASPLSYNARVLQAHLEAMGCDVLGAPDRVRAFDLARTAALDAAILFYAGDYMPALNVVCELASRGLPHLIIGDDRSEVSDPQTGVPLPISFEDLKREIYARWPASVVQTMDLSGFSKFCDEYHVFGA